jgi:hypothetical protein
MDIFHTWRELLGKVINNSQEQQRLAHYLGVPPGLLMDWACNLATPEPPQIYQLIMALPEHHAQFLPLLAEEFERVWAQNLPPTSSFHIPSKFYAQVLNGSMIPPQPLRFWTLSQMILQQALRHLDPVGLGLSIQLIRCMSPGRQGKIRSLRMVYSLGTTPWRSYLSSQTFLLGAESLAGYAVSGRCSAVVHSQAANILYPAPFYEHAESQVAYPIMRAELVAGCLLISSTQPAYFDSMQISLVQQYADLLTLAFESEEFYAPWVIELHLLPALSLQRQRLLSFRQRLEVLIRNQQQERNNIEQLELQVWQQFEEEFLQLSLNGLVALEQVL